MAVVQVVFGDDGGGKERSIEGVKSANNKFIN